jgi:Cu(I)/Ag(I) efflux system membrane fusion protein
MNKNLAIAAGAVALIGAAGGWWYAGHSESHRHAWTQATDEQGHVYYTCPMHPQVRQDHPGNCPICGMKLVERQDSAPAPHDQAVMYWYDPMKPEVHFDKPGQSPFMDMQLVPKYGGGSAPGMGGTVVEIDPRMAQNLGMRTARVTSGSSAQGVHAVGSVTIDEKRIVAIEARAAGWVERLDVRAVGDAVAHGQVVAAIYAPEMLAAQEELALAKKLGDHVLIDAARARLRLLGVGESGVGARQSAIVAPQAGVVTELLVRQGEQVSPGMPLMKLADLSKVWIVVEVPEAQAAAIAAGASAEASLRGVPGRAFKGTVEYVYPILDSQSRTLRARLSFDNADGSLKPGMYADVSIAGGSGTAVTLVPTEAVIRTGTRSVILISEAPGRYRPVEVHIGSERGEQTEIIDGLQPGQEVVVSGQFLIDSEASLLGAYNRMADDSPAGRMRLMGEEQGPAVYGNSPDGAPQ